VRVLGALAELFAAMCFIAARPSPEEEVPAG